MKSTLTAGLTAILILIMCGCSSVSNGYSSSADAPVQPESADQSTEALTQRVVSTTVAVTQIMDALNIDLVGVPTSAKVLPERYKEVTKVGNPMGPDMEVVRSLKPTEVLSVTTLKYDLEPKFESAGVNADFLDLTSLGKMKNAITDLGEKYDREKEAAVIVTKYNDKVAELEQKVKGKEGPSVLILMGVPGSYLVATEHSYIGDLVKLIGGRSVVQGETVEFLASNTEYLQQANPDVILRAAHGMPEEVVQMFDKEFQQNDIWKHFNAVANNRVYDLEEGLFGTTGNLLANEALDALMEMLYP